jgi:hypothetical protein
MHTGRSQPSIVSDVQTLVTHAASVATMEREMGYTPRLIRAPDVCYLFQARDQERLPGLMDRWHAYGIEAHVVMIPPTGGNPPATVIQHHNPGALGLEHRDVVSGLHPEPIMDGAGTHRRGRRIYAEPV